MKAQKENIFRRAFRRSSYIYILLTAAWFITISFIIDNYWSGNSSIDVVQKNIAGHINKCETSFDKKSLNPAFINEVINKKYDEEFLQKLLDKKYYLFIYKPGSKGKPEMDFWSTQVIEPPLWILADKNKSGFAQLSNGYYVWRKDSLKGYVSVGLIPVKWNYSIANEYLQNSFVIDKDLDNEYDISDEETRSAVKSIDGTLLFYLQHKPVNIMQHNNMMAVVFRLLAAFLVLLFIHLVAFSLAHRNFLTGAFFLLIMVTGLRAISYFLPLPLNFRQFELFDPAIYGSDAVFRSLGDLLINALLFLWLLLFLKHFIQRKHIAIRIKNPFFRWIVLIAGVFFLLVSTREIGAVVRSMVSDSQISFDVVNFFTLNVYSVLGFVILSCVAIGYFFLTQVIVQLFWPLLPENILWKIVIVPFAGLGLLTARIGHPSVNFELILLAWLLLYLLLLTNRNLVLDIAHLVSSRLIFWLFFFSVSIASIIIIENGKKEMENRKHYAETLAAKADPSSERLMNTVLTDFRSEVLGPLFNEFKTDSTNKSLKDSLISENFSGYLNKYDTRIYTFNEAEQPLYNQEPSTFNTLNTILRTQGKPTAIADLYYYDISYDRYSYISRKDITDSAGKLLGYVFIIATPKQYKTDALYPELFLKGYNNSIENSPVYSYAVYNNLELVNSHNDYPFSSKLTEAQVPSADYTNSTRKGYDELWYKAGLDKVVIIAKEDNLFIESITLFSYMFCAFIFISALFWLINLLVRSKLKWKQIRVYWQMTIRNQVHSTIIFISFLQFVIIGVATILFFINRYHNNNREKLSQTIQVMENEVRNSLTEMAMPDSALKIYDNGYRQMLEQTISKISEINAVDVNIYDIDGNLQVSSLPLPYNKGIVSNKMNPLAYYHLNQLKEIQYFQEETIGSLQYLSNYVPVIDKSGNAFAYLNIPYFTSQTKLRQEISNFLVAIINLNAFIFLIAGVIALVITNRITRSFSFISNRMKEVNLGSINKEIVWKRKDEIGELVKEYNKMVTKLDERAASLAKNEREGAWREMARQVAHEIKNPLTPMKLSLQYLQRAIDNNSEDVKALSISVSKTLVEQIDHLSQIAGDFSQFANIGNPKNEVFDLNESLRQLTQLHSTEENLQLDWNPLPQPATIYADRTHINRLFTNLIQNAIQAVPQQRVPHIQIDEDLLANKVIIKIKDNGDGIDEALQSSIFAPNFTTKTSGTGLGLAMCKGIVEQSKGHIWFQTSKGSGTTFFVELPLAEV